MRNVIASVLSGLFFLFATVANATLTGTMTMCPMATIPALTHHLDPVGTWSSSATSIATVVGSTGAITGVTSGTAIITYTDQYSVTETGVVTVSPGPTALISTSPGGWRTCVGVQITANCTPAGGDWTSTNTDVGYIGTVTGGGAHCDFVGGTTEGTTVISYTFPSGCSTYAVMTVGLPAITPLTSHLCVGDYINVQCLTGHTWSSTNPSAGTVGVTSGICSGISADTFTLVFTYFTGCIKTRLMTVGVPEPITGSLAICVGNTTDLDNATAGGTWSSSNTGVATVNSSTGLVTGVSAGTATISYIASAGCYTTVDVTVNALPATITGTLTVCVGLTTTLSSAMGGGSWTSGNTAVATVGISSGIVTGISTGVAAITYTSAEGCSTTTSVTVNSSPGAITGTLAVCVGATTDLDDPTAGGTWSSSNTTVATINSLTGVVTGMSAGTTSITYTAGASCYATAEVTVNPNPAAITGQLGVCVGLTVTLSNATSGGTWSSSNTSVATVNSSTGVVTGVAAGTSIISYTLSTGCYAAVVVTVVLSAPGAISGANTVCDGFTTTLTCSPAGGTWSSGNTTVATVGVNTGVVTGQAAGTASIIYTLGAGCSTNKIITVNAVPTIATHTAHICIGTNQINNLGNNAARTWSSSNTAIVTITNPDGDVSGIAAGTATITWTINSTGCYSTHDYTVHPVPTMSGTAIVCAGGGTTTLTPSDDYGTWGPTGPTGVLAYYETSSGLIKSIASTSASGTSNITFKLWGFDGCAVVTAVTVNPLPVITPTTSVTVCVGSPTYTLVGTASGGTWASNNTAKGTVDISTGVVTGIATGTCRITYTLSNGCYTTKTINVTTCGGKPQLNDNGEGILSGTEHYLITPNPSNGNIDILQNNVDGDNIRVVIVSVTGTVIYDYELAFRNGKGSVVLKDAAPGLYFVSLSNEKGRRENYKILVQK